ncbi:MULTISPECIES: hypothetical protein [unclassified Streptomyces]|uniref:hypothetical protein n=1 Tax=unclassified Streptomyces TaxID=2593676 RepID=UPI002E350CAB|nr:MULTISPECIES: hypothetical protein [unclassified Streptomyces]WUC68137.1 hypothetical protein OG861_30000 [Streptomyces sp. NBC_00539]
MVRGLLGGAAAGAAGTTALNVVTYLDMVVRGRGASSVPEHSVEVLAAKAGVPIPGDEDQHANRLAGLGALSGLFVGIGIGAAVGVARGLGWRPGTLRASAVVGLGAMALVDGPVVALGISDPRAWAAVDWAADVVPHLVYGAVTAAVAQGLDRDGARD